MKNWHIYDKNGKWFMICYSSLADIFADFGEQVNKIQILIESEEKDPLYIWEELGGFAGRWIPKEKVALTKISKMSSEEDYGSNTELYILQIAKNALNL